MKWYAEIDLNYQPQVYKSCALTIELSAYVEFCLARALHKYKTLAHCGNKSYSENFAFR